MKRSRFPRIAAAFGALALVAAVVSPTATTAGSEKDIVDTAVEAGSFTTLAQALTAAGLVDTLTTRRLVDEVYRYTGLFEVDTLVLDPAARQLTGSLSRPFLELAQAAIIRRDEPATIEYLRRAVHLMPNSQLSALLERIQAIGLEGLLRESQAPRP